MDWTRPVPLSREHVCRMSQIRCEESCGHLQTCTKVCRNEYKNCAQANVCQPAATLPVAFAFV